MLPEDLADLSDPDTYSRGVPHDTFRALRREAPIYFQKERKGRGFWALTKYEDIVVASKDPMRFSSARGGTNIEDYRGRRADLDPPHHAQHGPAAARQVPPAGQLRVHARWSPPS